MYSRIIFLHDAPVNHNYRQWTYIEETWFHYLPFSEAFALLTSSFRGFFPDFGLFLIGVLFFAWPFVLPSLLAELGKFPSICRP